MSGKMKKLICALLTGTMLLSSAGMLAFADADTPGADDAAVTTEATEAPEAAEATEAPEAAEATEAPEAAEATEAPAAPVAVATKYDNDNYYQKALALCQGLGIIKGDEQGNVNPENLVTRAEMAAIILRMLNNNTLSTYQNIFSDVSTSHWAADTVQTASALGIVNGFPGGTFVPDGDVQYEQIAKMIVCAMNYGNNANLYGGYPNGHMKVASDLDITNSAPGSVGVASERGVVIKMVYNALLADYNEPMGMQYGQQQYKAERTLAEYAFDVKEAKGVLLGTATTSLTGSTLLKGQAVLKENGEDEIVVYSTALENLDDILASNVTYYYTEKNGDARELLAIAENSAKTETRTISSEELEDIDEGDFNITGGLIKLYSSKQIKITENPTIIYNGSVITEADFDAALAADKDKKDTRLYNLNGEPYTFNEFLKPAVGSVKLVDNDTDNKYDIVFINSYETLLIQSATAKKVSAKINGAVAPSINVDEESYDLTIKTTINGMDAAPRNLKKNNVASLKRSFDGETMEFVVTGETITGSVSSDSTDNNGNKIVTISGKDYKVDANAADDCKIGTQAVFYFDLFGRIGYVESATSDGMLQSGEKYGWLMTIYKSEDGEDDVVRIYTQEGKVVEAVIASSVDYWAPTATESTTLREDAASTISTLFSSNSFIKMSTTPIRLVKYKVNGENKLNRLYCAVDSTKVTDERALRINTTNLRSKPSSNGTVAGYGIADGIMEFTVPMQTTDMTSASNYKVGEVASASYVVRENGAARDFIIGEFKGSSANILINFTASAMDPDLFTGVDSAGSGPSVMIVNSIGIGVDDDDNPIYTISGISGGSPVSVTTNRNTNFGDAKAALWGGSGSRYYQVTPLWNAANMTKTDKEAAMTITALNAGEKGLKKGDILLYTANGNILMRYASAAAAKFNEEGVFQKSSIPTIGANNYSNSSSRVHYYFDKVMESDSDDFAWVKLEGVSDNITFDPSTAIDIVTITKKTGKVSIQKEAAENTDIQEGDYLFACISDKGTVMKSIIIYRFED